MLRQMVQEGSDINNITLCDNAWCTVL